MTIRAKGARASYWKVGAVRFRRIRVPTEFIQEAGRRPHEKAGGHTAYWSGNLRGA